METRTFETRAGRITLVGLLVTFAVGCGTQIGDEGKPRETPTGTCEPVPTVLTPEDVNPLGFTGASVLAAVQGERVTDMQYDATGFTTGLVVEIIAGGELRWVEETWVPAEGADPAAEPHPCDSRLEIDGVFRFQTADGAFDERFPVVIVSANEGYGRIENRRVEYADLNGTYLPDGFVPEEHDEAYLLWTIQAQTTTMGGEIHLDAHRIDADEWFGDGMRFPVP